MNRARHTAPLPRNLLDALKEAGVDVAALAASVGLTFEQLENDLTFEQVDRIGRAIWAVLPDPAFGLMAGRLQRSYRFGILGFVAMTSPSFGVALARFVRYSRLIWGDRYELQDQEHEATVSLHPLKPEPVYQQLKFDFELAALLAFGRTFVDPALCPLHVTVRGPAPSYAARYGETFSCPIRFDCQRHSIVFSRRDLDRRMISANVQLSPVFEQHAEERLSELAEADLASRVRAVLRNMLRGEEPTLAGVASVLHMSPRTLQRHLAAVQLNFRDLLDSVRKDLAKHYLLNRAGSTMEISYLLGFSDPNSFFRAFKRWTGTTPENFRATEIDKNR